MALLSFAGYGLILLIAANIARGLVVGLMSRHDPLRRRGRSAAGSSVSPRPPALLAARPDLRLVVLEKEPTLAAHQSGHNSGVVHAGLYYAPGSLKARLCREGKAELEAFCAARDIPLERVGKLVVALGPEELPRLTGLVERATANGVPGLEVVGPGAHPRDRAPRRRDPRPVEPDDRDRRLPAGRPRVRRRRLVRAGGQIRIGSRGHGDPPGRAGPGPDRRGRRGRADRGRGRLRRAVERPGRRHDRRRCHGRTARLGYPGSDRSPAPDRALPGRLSHPDRRRPASRPRAHLSGPRPALPVPRDPLHPPDRRRGLGRAERRPRLRPGGLSAARRLGPATSPAR